ncbi:MAG: hypothetical protein ACOCU1_00805 [Bacillota bacterium]
MKTIAFLSVLFSVLLVSPQSVSMQSKSHDSIKTEVEKGEITIIYEGDNRFTTHVSTGDYTYYVNQTLRNNDTTIVYGFTIDKPLREHHAFILFLNSDGEIIRHDVFEDIKLAEFIEHYQFENSLIFRMRESIEEEYSTKEVKNHFFRYEDNFATYQTETIDSEIKVIDVVEDKLVMKQAYNEPYAYGLDVDLTRYETEKIYGASDKDSFEESVTVFTLNEATIDGETFSHHHEITYPGHHHIKTELSELTVTVHPKIDDIENNMTYDAPVSLDTLQGRLVLNGQVLASGETISDPGNYTLVIEGANGYEKRIDFTVLSSVSGVYNNQIYDSKRTLTFNGVGYLNNTYIETGHTVNKPGIYTLDILGDNDYRETLQFEIRSIEEDDTNNTLLYVEIGLLATIVISTGVLLIKYKLKA